MSAEPERSRRSCSAANLRKTFRRGTGEVVHALDGVSLEVGRGHAHGAGRTRRRGQDDAAFA